MKRIFSIIAICILLISMHVMAHASGYGVFTHGAKAFERTCQHHHP